MNTLSVADPLREPADLPVFVELDPFSERELVELAEQDLAVVAEPEVVEVAWRELFEVTGSGSCSVFEGEHAAKGNE